MWYFQLFEGRQAPRKYLERQKGKRERPKEEREQEQDTDKFKETFSAFCKILPVEQFFIFRPDGGLVFFYPDIPWNVGYLRRSVDRVFSTLSFAGEQPDLLVKTPKRYVLLSGVEGSVAGVTVCRPYDERMLRLSATAYASQLVQLAPRESEEDVEKVERAAARAADVLQHAFSAYSRLVGPKVAQNFYRQTVRKLHKPFLMRGVVIDRKGKAKVNFDRLDEMDFNGVMQSTRMFVFDYARCFFPHVGELRSMEVMMPLVEELELAEHMEEE